MDSGDYRFEFSETKRELRVLTALAVETGERLVAAAARAQELLKEFE